MLILLILLLLFGGGFYGYDRGGGYGLGGVIILCLVLWLILRGRW